MSWHFNPMFFPIPKFVDSCEAKRPLVVYSLSVAFLNLRYISSVVSVVSLLNSKWGVCVASDVHELNLASSWEKKNRATTALTKISICGPRTNHDVELLQLGVRSRVRTPACPSMCFGRDASISEDPDASTLFASEIDSSSPM